MKLTIIEMNAEEIRANRRLGDALVDALVGVCDSITRFDSKEETEDEEEEEEHE